MRARRSAVPIVGAAVVILLPAKQIARYLALAVSLAVLMWLM